MPPKSPDFFLLEGEIQEGRCETTVYIASLTDRFAKYEELQFMPCRALIDSGAAGLALSPHVRDELKLVVTGHETGTGFGGDRVNIETVNVVIDIDGEGDSYCHGVVGRVLHTPKDFDAVIGMSLLMQGVLVVDGPAQKWKWRIGTRPPREGR